MLYLSQDHPFRIAAEATVMELMEKVEEGFMKSRCLSKKL